MSINMENYKIYLMLDIYTFTSCIFRLYYVFMKGVYFIVKGCWQLEDDNELAIIVKERKIDHLSRSSVKGIGGCLGLLEVWEK